MTPVPVAVDALCALGLEFSASLMYEIWILVILLYSDGILITTASAMEEIGKS